MMEVWNKARGWLRNAGFACVILSPTIWIVSLVALEYAGPESEATFVSAGISNYLAYIGVAFLIFSLLGKQAKRPGAVEAKRDRFAKIITGIYIFTLWLNAAVAALRIAAYIVFGLLWRSAFSHPSPEFKSLYSLMTSVIVTLIVISPMLFIAAWLVRVIVRGRAEAT